MDTIIILTACMCLVCEIDVEITYNQHKKHLQVHTEIVSNTPYILELYRGKDCKEVLCTEAYGNDIIHFDALPGVYVFTLSKGERLHAGGTIEFQVH